MCGRAHSGQLGLGSIDSFPLNERSHRYQPTFCQVSSMHAKKVTIISCGGEHTVLTCANNQVYSMGSGLRGQLGSNNAALMEPQVVESLAKMSREILHLACGNSCTFFVLGKYQLVTSLADKCLQVIYAHPQLVEALRECSENGLFLLEEK